MAIQCIERSRERSRERERATHPHTMHNTRHTQHTLTPTLRAALEPEAEVTFPNDGGNWTFFFNTSQSFPGLLACVTLLHSPLGRVYVQYTPTPSLSHPPLSRPAPPPFSAKRLPHSLSDDWFLTCFWIPFRWSLPPPLTIARSRPEDQVRGAAGRDARVSSRWKDSATQYDKANCRCVRVHACACVRLRVGFLCLCCRFPSPPSPPSPPLFGVFSAFSESPLFSFTRILTTCVHCLMSNTMPSRRLPTCLPWPHPRCCSPNITGLC